ncbi:MAG: hypothetical protein ACJASY_003777 [Halioglobus sp.]
MTEIESIVEPDCVTDDVWWKSVSFICIHPLILSNWVFNLAVPYLSFLYPNSSGFSVENTFTDISKLFARLYSQADSAGENLLTSALPLIPPKSARTKVILQTNPETTDNCAMVHNSRQTPSEDTEIALSFHF